MMPRVLLSASYSNRPVRAMGSRRNAAVLRRFATLRTDFTMMLTAFPGRTQRQLKNKFKRENRTQSTLVTSTLTRRARRGRTRLWGDPEASTGLMPPC